MKIVHICMVGAGFNDGWGYQENMLSRINSMNGHKVSIITTQYVRNQLGKLEKINKTNYLDEYSCDIYRLPLKKGYRPGNRFRRFMNMESVLYKIDPDIILVHNFQFVDMFEVLKYVRYNNSKLYIDSHTDANNSGKNWLSVNILHKLIYKYIMQRSLRYASRIYYISEEVKEFLKSMYGVPENKLEFFPLGGTVISEEEKYKYRLEIRKSMNFMNEEIVFCHSGKMDEKKKTIEIIKSFSNVDDSRLRLLLIGKFGLDIEDEVKQLISKDARIFYLGWKKTDDLYKYIAASDLYIQPGSQSATMQSALCLGTPVMVSDTKSYHVFDRGNLFVVDNDDKIVEVFMEIVKNPDVLKHMSVSSFRVARELLNYDKLSNQYVENKGEENEIT